MNHDQFTLELDEAEAEGAAQDTQGLAYFIQAGNSGPIKIGWTSGDPIRRLMIFQVGNAEELRLIGRMAGVLDDEGELHARFKRERLRGEWFSPTPALLEFIALQASLSAGLPAGLFCVEEPGWGPCV